MFYFSGEVLAPSPPPPSPSGSGGMLPREIVKFYTYRDVFSSILKLQRMWSNYQKNIISNSLPTNEDICSSVISTWSVCYSACVKVLCFTTINKHGRSTEANVMSSTAFCGRIMLAPRKKKIWRKWKKKTQNRQGFACCWGCWSGYDAKTAKNLLRGIQSRIRWVAWLQL